MGFWVKFRCMLLNIEITELVQLLYNLKYRTGDKIRWNTARKITSSIGTITRLKRFSTNPIRMPIYEVAFSNYVTWVKENEVHLVE